MGERQRLNALHQLHLLDTPPDDRFDRVVRLAQQFFKVSTVAVNLIDESRQWTKAGVGVPEHEMPRDISFCSRAVEHGEILHVVDAREDPRFRHNPLVTEPDGIRFYAGQPLRAPNGQRVGALCLADGAPRELSATELRVLQDLGEWVEKEMASDQEFSQAAAVQRQLSPRTAVDVPGYDVAGMCVAARAVGGDFFDWTVVDDHLQVTLADVMGKGMGAALVAAGVRAVLRGASQYPLGEALERSAISLEGDLQETGSFVTAFIARIDLRTGELAYADAGHGLAVIFQTDGGFRRLRTGGMPIGVLADDAWEVRHTVLEPGETLFLVSDGMLDYFPDPWTAVDTAQQACASSSSAHDFLDQVREVASCQRHEDDITAVVVRRLAGEA